MGSGDKVTVGNTDGEGERLSLLADGAALALGNTSSSSKLMRGRTTAKLPVTTIRTMMNVVVRAQKGAFRMNRFMSTATSALATKPHKKAATPTTGSNTR